MSNICSNELYAYSELKENIEAIENFFKNYPSADIENNDDSVDVYFDSNWTFPEEKMNELFDQIPNKEDIYMRCLSVEYGCLYHALWICNNEGWREV